MNQISNQLFLERQSRRGADHAVAGGFFAAGAGDVVDALESLDRELGLAAEGV